jgi:UDP-N-acetylmuramate: L-alanyl-gamma-D-glutamyl-meso-diaminopimelate ligase
MAGARTSCAANGCWRVAGTHGKTTTTSLLAWILDEAKTEPGLPGRRRPAGLRRFGPAHRLALLRDRGRRVRHGLSATSAPSSCITSPRTAILNNLEFDHADIFSDLAAIETQFHHLMRTSAQKRPGHRGERRGGRFPEARAGSGLLDAGRMVQQYVEGWQAGGETGCKRFTDFAVKLGAWPQGRVPALSISPGTHNRANALAAIGGAQAMRAFRLRWPCRRWSRFQAVSSAASKYAERFAA